MISPEYTQQKQLGKLFKLWTPSPHPKYVMSESLNIVTESIQNPVDYANACLWLRPSVLL